MTLKQYLILMSIATGICALAWLFVIFNIDPESGSILGFIFFYSTLFFTLVGAYATLGFLLKQLFGKSDEIEFRAVKKTFRQGVTLSAFVIFTLFLQQVEMLNWWTATIILIMFAIVEGLVFQTKTPAHLN